MSKKDLKIFTFEYTRRWLKTIIALAVIIFELITLTLTLLFLMPATLAFTVYALIFLRNEP